MKDLAIVADIRNHLIRHGLADFARRPERALALFVEVAISVQAVTVTATPSQFLHLQAVGVPASGLAVRVTVLLGGPEADLVAAKVPLSVEMPVDRLLPLISAEIAEDRPPEAVGP